MGFQDLKNIQSTTSKPTIAPTSGGFAALKAMQTSPVVSPTIQPTTTTVMPKLTTPSTGLFSGASATAQAGASVNKQPITKQQSQSIGAYGFTITPEMLKQTEEKIIKPIKKQSEFNKAVRQMPIVEKYRAWGFDIPEDMITGYTNDGVPLGPNGKKMLFWNDPFAIFKKETSSQIPLPGDPEYQYMLDSRNVWSRNKGAEGTGFIKGLTSGLMPEGDYVEKAATGQLKSQQKLKEKIGEEAFNKLYSSESITEGTTRPTAMMLSEIGGNLTKFISLYQALGPAIESAVGTALQGTKLATSVLSGSKLSAFIVKMLAEQAKDAAISLPLSISEGLQSGKEGADLIKYVLGQIALDIGANLGMSIPGLLKGKFVDEAVKILGKDPALLKQIDEVTKSLKTVSIKPTQLDMTKVEIPKIGKQADNIVEPIAKQTDNVAEQITKQSDILTQKPAQQIVSGAKEKTTFKQKLNNLYSDTIDRTHVLKDIGETTQTKALNTARTGGTVDFILEDGMVDMNYNKIGKSLKETVSPIPEKQLDDFYEYLYQRHNIARSANGKPIYTDFDAVRSKAKVDALEKKFPIFKQVGDELDNYYKALGDEWLVKSGLVPKELMDSLQELYPHYVFAKRNLDVFSSPKVKGFVDTGDTLKSATGPGEDLLDPIQNTMTYTNAIIRTAKNNEVGQTIVDAVRKNPDELRHLAELVETPKELTNKINKALASGDFDEVLQVINQNANRAFEKQTGRNIVTVMENGSPVQLRINDRRLYDVLTQVNNVPMGEVEKTAKKVTNLFKQAITQKNPFFAVRNIARDIPTAYVFGSEKNPIKFARDLKNAAQGVITESPEFLKFKAAGGMGSNFFASDKVLKAAKEITQKPSIGKKILKAPLEGIDTFNNITETIPRFAEFSRVLKKTGDMDKALLAASEATVNFSRGGKITKSIDSFVPYLNASVQGLDKIAREIIKNPVKTISGGLLGITAPTVGLYLINMNNEKYKALDNRVKDNYFLIPTGSEKNPFIKLPKSRELGVLFGSLFERTLRKFVEKDPEAYKKWGNTALVNFAPTNPLESNIFAPALMNLKSNKDFAGRTIVPMGLQARSPELQYDEKTSEIAKFIGKVAKISPKKVDYLIDSYTGVIGDILLPATTVGGSPGKMVTNQFTANPLYNNQEITDFYDYKDEIDQIVADKNATENIPSKVLTPEEKIKSVFTKASKQIGEYYDLINKIEYDKNLTRAEKDMRIATYRKMIIKIATDVNKQYRRK